MSSAFQNSFFFICSPLGGPHKNLLLPQVDDHWPKSMSIACEKRDQKLQTTLLIVRFIMLGYNQYNHYLHKFLHLVTSNHRSQISSDLSPSYPLVFFCRAMGAMARFAMDDMMIYHSWKWWFSISVRQSFQGGSSSHNPLYNSRLTTFYHHKITSSIPLNPFFCSLWKPLNREYIGNMDSPNAQCVAPS